MPLPFFCAICDKPIKPSVDRKYVTIHDKCMDEYLNAFEISSADEYNKSTTTNNKDNK
tara:strand:- start:180 stop:353 length:174 start_codon:yes stop_codon:yes gene_type:complete